MVEINFPQRWPHPSEPINMADVWVFLFRDKHQTAEINSLSLACVYPRQSASFLSFFKHFWASLPHAPTPRSPQRLKEDSSLCPISFSHQNRVIPPQPAAAAAVHMLKTKRHKYENKYRKSLHPSAADPAEPWDYAAISAAPSPGKNMVYHFISSPLPHSLPPSDFSLSNM